MLSPGHSHVCSTQKWPDYFGKYLNEKSSSRHKPSTFCEIFCKLKFSSKLINKSAILVKIILGILQQKSFRKTKQIVSDIVLSCGHFITIFFFLCLCMLIKRLINEVAQVYVPLSEPCSWCSWLCCWNNASFTFLCYWLVMFIRISISTEQFILL